MKDPLISIHPRIGYQNTDFVLWANKKEQSLTVTLLPENEKIFLPDDRTHVVKRFSAGNHKLIYCDTSGNVIEEVSFSVKDSIKVGCSKVRGEYVLPHWIIMVTSDRTYFYNRNTRNEFFEYGIYPEKIIEVTEDLLCFIDDKVYSFFSISQLSSILHTREANLIHYDEYKIIYIEAETVRFYFVDSGEHVDVNCKSYVVNNKEELFFYDSIEQCIKKVVLKSSNFEIKSYFFNSEYQFGAFTEDGFVVFKDIELNLHIYDMDDLSSSYLMPIKALCIANDLSLASFLLIQKDRLSIGEILTIRILDLRQRTFTFEKLRCNSYGSPIDSYLVFDNDIDNALCLREVRFLCKDEKYAIFQRPEYGRLILLDLKNKSVEDLRDVLPDVKVRFLYIDGKYAVLKKYGEESLILLDLSIKSTNTVNDATFLRYAERGFYCVKSERDKYQYSIFDLSGEELISCDDYSYLWKSDFEKYGVVQVSGQLYYFINGGFVRDEYNKNPRSPIVEKDGGYYYVYVNEELRPLPYEIKFHCGDGDCLIYEENDQWLMLEWNSFWKKYNGPYELFRNHDSHSFKNVMFCEGHNKLLCQLEDNTFCYYNLETDEFDKFELQTSVVRNFNANQMLVSEFEGKENDKYRRVVYKDPVTLKEITPECLSQYGFFSIDKRYGVTYSKKAPLYKLIKSGKNERKCISVHDNKDDLDINVFVDRKLVYVNYITFSYDSKYMAVVGATQCSGYLLIYDLVNGQNVVEYSSTTNSDKKDRFFALKAIWIGSFNKDNALAIYNSNPTTYIFEEKSNYTVPKELRKRNFLCFSPSGRFFASSTQGYTAYAGGCSNWGHQPSTKVFINRTDDLNKEMGPFEDLGKSGIPASKKDTVGSVAFSLDETKLLVVAGDGTFVVRNIRTDIDSNWNYKDKK